MHIFWIKRMSFGVVIVNLVMVCGYLFLTVLALSTPTSFRNRVEMNMVLSSFSQNLFTPSSILTGAEVNRALPGSTPNLFTPSVEVLHISDSTYDRWIRTACRKYSLDPALVMAVIHAESQFDPLAVSPRGAVGLMQLSPVVTRELGINDPFNPQLNIDGGVRYLKGLLVTFDGDKELALAAYNAGPTQVYRYNGVPPFKDTQKYLKQVFHYLAFYQKNPVYKNLSLKTYNPPA
jgi:soluble lytic murein transglycosylase-like protein